MPEPTWDTKDFESEVAANILKKLHKDTNSCVATLDFSSLSRIATNLEIRNLKEHKVQIRMDTLNLLHYIKVTLPEDIKELLTNEQDDEIFRAVGNETLRQIIINCIDVHT